MFSLVLKYSRFQDKGFFPFDRPNIVYLIWFGYLLFLAAILLADVLVLSGWDWKIKNCFQGCPVCVSCPCSRLSYNIKIPRHTKWKVWWPIGDMLQVKKLFLTNKCSNWCARSVRERKVAFGTLCFTHIHVNSRKAMWDKRMPGY